MPLSITQMDKTDLTIKTKGKKEVEGLVLLLVASSGFAKTLSGEKIAQEFHKLGWIIVSLTDPKDEWEYCYTMFKPREQYHLDILKVCGIEPESFKVDIFHPFTFNIPKYKPLPDINFFTIPMKSLTREEMSMLLETAVDSHSLKLILEGFNSLKKTDGLYRLMNWIQLKTEKKEVVYGDKKFYKSDPDLFFLKSSMAGTIKDVGEIGSTFKPFDNNYFLAPENCPFNLNIREHIFKNTDRYKIFVYKYIKDEKIRNFAMMYVFNEIMRNIEYSPKPILFIIEEVRKVTPQIKGSPAIPNYKSFLANSIKSNLSLIRNRGRGCGAILTTQVYFDVDDKVRDSATDTLIGNLGGIEDQSKLSKASRYSKDIFESLTELTRNEFLLKGKESQGSFKIFLPSHRHAEAHYNFIEEYSKEFELKKYYGLINEMRGIWKKDRDIVAELSKRQFDEDRKIAEESYAKRMALQEDRLGTDVLREKIRDMKEVDREKIMDKCYDIYNEMEKPTYRGVGKILLSKEGIKLSHKTIKLYIESVEKEKIKNPVDLNDEEVYENG